MSRKIIVCIDGTGNEIGDRESNILKLYKALDKSKPESQIARYVMGVGTYDGPQFLGRTRQVVSGLLGQAFGYGLEDDVLEAYRYLCRTYQSREQKQALDPGLSDDAAEGDHIYLVGFSRGAYAARVLAGFIHNFGLVTPDNLHLITPVFRAYRRVTDFDRSEKDERVFQALREYERVLDPEPAPVRALLLFDTVSSMVRFRRPLYNLRHFSSFAEMGTHLRSTPTFRSVSCCMRWRFMNAARCFAPNPGCRNATRKPKSRSISATTSATRKPGAANMSRNAGFRGFIPTLAARRAKMKAASARSRFCGCSTP